MEEHQIHFERKFTRDKKTGYWLSTTIPRERAHRWVWKNHHRSIPKGYHIHHRDEDRSNNVIGNLELLTPSEHVKKHFTEERRAKFLKIAEENRELTKAWHKSPEGKAWHKAHGILLWKNRKPIKKKCGRCLLQFSTKTFHQQFCSNNCKSAWRRSQGLDNEERTCALCEKAFTVNRYSKAKCCSISCGRKLSYRTQSYNSIAIK